MPKKIKNQKSTKVILIGIIIMLMIMIAASAIGALMLYSGKIDNEQLILITSITLFIGSTICSYYVCRKVKSKKIMWSGAAVAAIVMMRLIISAACENRILGAEMLYGNLAAAVGYVAGSIPGVYKRKTRRRT